MTEVDYDVSTLEEPIGDTILRDLKAIGRKALVVAVPMLGAGNELRDWDLWGPLVFCMILAIILGGTAGGDQGGSVFAAVFALVWLGSGVVTLNAKFLGAKVSFFQSVCVMGYCIAPMCVAAILSLIVRHWLVHLIAASAAWVWSTYAALRFYRGCVRPEREWLVVYPVALFFFFLSWMTAVGI